MIYLKTRVLYLSLEDDWSNTQAKSLLLRNPFISNLLEFFNRIVLGSDVKFTQNNYSTYLQFTNLLKQDFMDLELRLFYLSWKLSPVGTCLHQLYNLVSLNMNVSKIIKTIMQFLRCIFRKYKSRNNCHTRTNMELASGVKHIAQHGMNLIYI